MDEVIAIKKELREDCGNPFYQVAKAVLDPMVKKIKRAERDGLKFPEEYPKAIEWSEIFQIAWQWGLAMQHESEIRAILKDCEEMLSV